MSTEPTYLPLLRRIANAEANAEKYFEAWAAATQRDDVRAVIATVGLREGEHAKSFQKRVCELGFLMEIDEAARVFTDPKAYADEKRFHAACARLRRESPVTRVEAEGFEPF